jgi:hypothetical protein
MLCAACALPAMGQQRTPYAALEIDRFVAESGVDFPVDYQIGVVEDLVRVTKRAFKSVEILREGEPLPQGNPVLRITGQITRFKPGNRAKRYLIGFGAGATVVKAHVKFTDAASGQVVLERDLQGITWMGMAGGGSEGAGDRLAKKIVELARSSHLLKRK